MENSKFARANRQDDASTAVVDFTAFRSKKVNSIARALLTLQAVEKSVAVVNHSAPPSSQAAEKRLNSLNRLATAERRNAQFAERMYAITEDEFYLHCASL